jgi:hypothetical protein
MRSGHLRRRLIPEFLPFGLIFARTQNVAIFPFFATNPMIITVKFNINPTCLCWKKYDM